MAPHKAALSVQLPNNAALHSRVIAAREIHNDLWGTTDVGEFRKSSEIVELA